MDARTVVNFVIYERVSKFLYDDTQVLDDQAKTFVDRLVLRLMGSPAILSFLEDINLLREDKDYLLEIVFRRIPESQIDPIARLIGHPATFHLFDQNGQTYYGFKVQIKPKDMQPPDAQDGSKLSMKSHWAA